MMEEVSEDLYDYEEPRGRLQIILHRTKWRWILAGIMALTFGIPFLLAQAFSANIVDPSRPSLLMTSPSHSLMPSFSTVKKQPNAKARSGSQVSTYTTTTGKPSPSSLSQREYKATGGSATSSLTNFTDFEGLSSMNKSLLTSVALQNLYLDAPQFSSALEGSLSLESIALENVWLIGNFSRVYLPTLSKFIYKQNGDDKRDSYKSPETLKSTLFFDKAKTSTLNVEQELLNLGVDITISKAGTMLLDIRRNQGEIYLNVKYCQDLLVNVKGPFDSLTLVNCNITSEVLPMIPSTLQYLNLRNSFPPTEPLSQLLRKQTHLKEFYGWLKFHCEWPGYELFVNVSDLPNTVKTLGLNNVDWSFLPGSSSSITELTVGNFMTETMISSGIPDQFQYLKRINVVNVSDPSPAAGYAIVNQVIKLKVKEIAIVNLHRNYSSVIGMGDEENEEKKNILEVEAILDQAGIPKQPTSSFILQLNSLALTGIGMAYTGRELSSSEQHEIRYRGLGFDKMDSLEDYLKWDSLQ